MPLSHLQSLVFQIPSGRCFYPLKAFSGGVWGSKHQSSQRYDWKTTMWGPLTSYQWRYNPLQVGFFHPKSLNHPFFCPAIYVPGYLITPCYNDCRIPPRTGNLFIEYANLTFTGKHKKKFNTSARLTTF